MSAIRRWREPRASGKGYRYMGEYPCSCGSTFVCEAGNYASGQKTKCADCSKGALGGIRSRHGHSWSGGAGPLEKKSYYTWQAMKRRCLDVDDKRYDRYGGRGISISSAWIESYAVFLEDMGLPPTMGHQIDRVDNDGDYEPGNCRWASRLEQARNQERSFMITAHGKTLHVNEWAEMSGIKPATIKKRIRNGAPPEDAVTQTRRLAGWRYVTEDGSFDHLDEVAARYGMSTSGAHGRFKSPSYPSWVMVPR